MWHRVQERGIASRSAARAARRISCSGRWAPAGELTAASYERLVASVQEEGDAARAEHERLLVQVSDREGEVAICDYESEVRDRWQTIREAVLRGSAAADPDPADLDAVRTEMLALFAEIVITPNDGGYSLSPGLRTEAIDGGWDRIAKPAGLAFVSEGKPQIKGKEPTRNGRDVDHS